MPPKLSEDASYTLFQRSFWRKLYALAAPFWFRPIRRDDGSMLAIGLLGILLVLIFATTGLLVKLNYQQGEFFTALSNKEEDRFWAAVWVYAGIIVVAVPILALKEYVLQRLAVLWREWMTDHLLKLYFCRRRAFFRLSVGGMEEKSADGSKSAEPQALDNPDQRIVADVESFTSAALNFIVVFLGAGMRVFSFGAILYSISVNLAIFLIFYAIFMTGAVTLIFGKRLAALNFIKRKCEADLRFALVRVRENAESIAMYNGGERELYGSRGLLQRMIENNLQVIWAMFGFEMFQNATQYLTGLLPALLVAPQYLAGEVEFGKVKQAQDAFMMLRFSLFVIANRTDEFSAFATGLGRLDTLLKAINGDGDDGDDGVEKSAKQGQDDEKDALLGGVEMQEAAKPSRAAGEGLVLSGMTVSVPKTRRLLIDQLNCALQPGESLLIMGPSGAGKTSLLRVLCGLWGADSGHSNSFGGDNFFLPQRVYMPMGSLAFCLRYPSAHQDMSANNQLTQALHTVGLSDLANGDPNREADWAHRLSPGEQQRLSFARLVLRGRCDSVFLDEATSALDTPSETRLYKTLSSLCETFVSVGHRETLVKFHTHVLLLQGEHHHGAWELVTREEFLSRRATSDASLALPSPDVGWADVGSLVGGEEGWQLHHRRYSPSLSRGEIVGDR